MNAVKVISLTVLFMFCARVIAAYPTVVICTRGGSDFPVHSVEGDKPVIREGSRDRTIGEPTVRIERNNSFQEGYITILEQKGWGSYNRVTSKGVSSLPTSEDQKVFRSFVNLKFVADVDYEDLYVVFVSYPADLKDRPCDLQEYQFISFDRIGDVKKGEIYEEELQAAFIPNRWSGTVEFVTMPLFFSKGLEVRSSASGSVGAYFRSLEECWHQELITSYLNNNKNQSLKHQSVITYVPLLSGPQLEEVRGERIIVRFQIEPDGTVEKVVLEQEVSVGVKSAIVEGVRGWLFLPKLAEGVAQSSVTRVPLSY